MIVTLRTLDIWTAYLVESRPDMTFAVDWALSNNYLSIYLSTLSKLYPSH